MNTDVFLFKFKYYYNNRLCHPGLHSMYLNACFGPKDNGNGFQRGKASDSGAWWKITADHL